MAFVTQGEEGKMAAKTWLNSVPFASESQRNNGRQGSWAGGPGFDFADTTTTVGDPLLGLELQDLDSKVFARIVVLRSPLFHSKSHFAAQSV